MATATIQSTDSVMSSEESHSEASGVDSAQRQPAMPNVTATGSQNLLGPGDVPVCQAIQHATNAAPAAVPCTNMAMSAVLTAEPPACRRERPSSWWRG